MKDLIGQSIGRYHIVEQLGQGGVAVVYKAYDTTLDCNVALKVIRSENIPSDSLDRTRKRFETEAKKTAQLSHPNIIPVIDYGEYEGMPYLVMKYVPGGTLKDKLAKLGKAMPYREAAAILLPLARALETAHLEGVVHRDVKPDNILITTTGEPMLSDFGIARVLDAEKRTIDTLSLKGFTVGTPEYMAPEQWRGEKIDGRADIYALGVVFFELLTGSKPFTADTVQAVMVKALVDPLPRPRSFVKDLPESVEQVLYRALDKKPENRFQTMGEFASALESLARGARVKIETGSSGKQRKWLVFGGLFALLAVLLGGFAYLSWKGSNTNKPISSSTIQPTFYLPPKNMKLLYINDFETENPKSFIIFNGDWQIVNDIKGNKVFQTKGINSNSNCVGFGPKDFSDGVIEFKFLLVNYSSSEEDGGKISLKFRTKSWGDEEYTLDFNPYYSTSDIAHADPYPTDNWENLGQIGFSANKNQWYSIRLELQGEEMTAFLDGKKIIKANDSRLKIGNLFFVVNPDAIVQFDDIKVYAP